MFVSKEEALAVHEQRHRLRCCKAGQGWLICPYAPSACYSIGHYHSKEEGWQQCPGIPDCPVHWKRPIPKVHVACLQHREMVMVQKCEGFRLEKFLPFKPALWHEKIFELTGGVIEKFCIPSQPDQLALCWREPGRANGPLHFRWLDTVLTDVPAELHKLDIPALLPCIIKDKHAVAATITPVDLDKKNPRPIKHKIG